MKGIYAKNLQFHSNGEGRLAFFSSMDLRQGCLPSSLLFDSILEILAYRRSQQIKSIQIKKENTKFLLLTEMLSTWKRKSQRIYQKATQNFCVSLARAQVTRTIQKINCIYIMAKLIGR